MRFLFYLCVTRQSVFDSQRRDTVLDITDLINDKIDPAAFFEENYITEGMKTLLERGFRRLEDKSRRFQAQTRDWQWEDAQPADHGAAGQTPRGPLKGDRDDGGIVVPKIEQKNRKLIFLED